MVAIKPIVSAHSGGAAAKAECSLDADCQGHIAANSNTVALCEVSHCRVYDADVAYQWARSIVPALDSFDPDLEITPGNASWYVEGAHVTLHVSKDWRQRTGRGKGCLGIDFQAQQGVLFADVDEQGRPAARYGTSYRLVLNAGAVVLLGPNWVSADGLLGGEGSMERVTHAELSSVDDVGLTYDGIRVKLTPTCVWLFVDRPQCADGACRTCQIVLNQRSLTRKLVHMPGGHTRATGDTCGPCLDDVSAPLVPHLATILKNREFRTTLNSPDALRFFRRQADCEAASARIRVVAP
ncbi:MAG: hypothetical protein NVS3B20_12300 [Polyangiales bacterium]